MFPTMDQGYNSASQSSSSCSPQPSTASIDEDHTDKTTVESPANNSPPQLVIDEDNQETSSAESESESELFTVSELIGHKMGKKTIYFLVRWEGYEEQTYEPKAALPLSMVYHYMSNSSSPFLRKVASQMNVESLPAGAAAPVEIHKENWKSLKFTREQILKYISHYDNYETSLKIELGLPPTKPCQALFLFNHMDHAYGAYVNAEGIHIYDGNNANADQYYRTSLERRLGKSYSSLPYLVSTRVDYCTSAVAAGTIEFIATMNQSGKPPTELRPSGVVREWFERVFHPIKNVSKLEEASTVPFRERIKSKFRTCPSCQQLVRKHGYNFHKCD